MKKLYLILALSFMMFSASAQDIIITKQSERIDCKVIEISETQVSYKQKSNPNGPLFTMSATRVASIIFENGEVYTFKDIPVQEQPTTESGNESHETPSWQEEPEVEIPITLPSGKTVYFFSGKQIEVINGKKYYGDFCFDKPGDYEDFLKQTCYAAYQENRESTRLAAIGAIPMIPGLVFMGIALWKEVKPMINGSMFEDDFDMWQGWGKPVLTWLGAGLGCVIISMPFITKSSQHDNNARTIFNRDCAQTPQKLTTAQISFGISPLGAGISLTF